MDGDTTSLPSAADMLRKEKEERRVLAHLLDDWLDRSGLLFVQRTEMGGTEAFIGSVTIQWLAQRIRFASQLPLFRQKIDESGKVAIDEETVHEIQQRPLDWSRQAPLAQYLAARRHHKFPPVLVVMSRPWVDDPYSDGWNPDGRAVESVAQFTPLDNKGVVGVLDVSEAVEIYALDGQHRLMGAQGLMQLIQTGELRRKKIDGKETDGVITVDDLVDEYGINQADVQTLGSERIGVELISAVTPRESREEARRRVRSIFVHVNRMASPLSKGQLALLNEDDGFSIVARAVGVTHPLLKDRPGRPARVNWDRSYLTKHATFLTTLQTLKEVAERYLSEDEERFRRWRPSEKGLIPMRPEDEQLELGQELVAELLDHIAALPSFQRLESEDLVPAELRRFTTENPPGEAHMLFRPVGQVALAQAAGELAFQRNVPLEVAFRKLHQLDESGAFRLDDPTSLWWGILFNPAKGSMNVSGRNLASRLLVHLLDDVPLKIEEAEKLRSDIQDARTIEDVTWAFDGSTLPSGATLELPEPV